MDMAWIIAFSVVLLLTALTTLFVVFARLLRRDLDERFDRLRVRLEHDANTLINNLLKERGES